MNTVEYLATVLDEDWTKTRASRSNDVPKPKIVEASPEPLRRMSLDQQDYLIVHAATTTRTPQSFGWAEERRENSHTIEMRTTEGRTRLKGHRDANNERDPYGGLTGEVEKILTDRRKGHKEFDLIEGVETNDLSGEYGGAVWVAVIEVRLDERARQL